MPAEYYYTLSPPTWGTPTYDDWAASSGTEEYCTLIGGGRAGPPVHNDGTNFVYYTGVASVWKYQDLQMDWPGPVAGVSSMTSNFRHRFSGGVGNSSRRFYLKSSEGASTGSSIQDTNTSWANTGNASETRPGGGSWAQTDFENDYTWGILYHYGNLAGSKTDVTSVWGLMTYTPPSSGFAYLMGLAGLSALPFVGPLTDLGHFRSYLAWRARYHPRRTTWAPGEAMEAWRDLRAYRWPAFLLP